MRRIHSGNHTNGFAILIMHRRFKSATWIQALAIALWVTAELSAEVTLDVEQLTTGPRHHFFGYIGHVQSVPWNASGRFILALETEFQLPGTRGDAVATGARRVDRQARRLVDDDRLGIDVKDAVFQHDARLILWPTRPNRHYFGGIQNFRAC